MATTQQLIHTVAVPEAVKHSSGIASVSLAGNGLAIVKAAAGGEAARFQVERNGAGTSIAFTRAGGKTITINLELSKDAAGDITASGTYDGDPFSTTVSKTGALLNRTCAKNVDPQDVKIFDAIASLKIDIPKGPPAFNPEVKDPRTREAANMAGGAGTIKPVGGPIATPAFSDHCVLAMLAVMAATESTAGFAFPLGMFILGWECHDG